MLALTGLLLKGPLFAYGIAVHGGGPNLSRGSEETVINLFCMYLCLTNIPNALMFDSTFLGYIVVVSFFFFLGFRCFFAFGCLMIWMEDGQDKVLLMSS